MRTAAIALVAVGLIAGMAPVALPSAPGGDSKVVFGRDIRPLLSDRCFVCHGPDEAKRKAKLRLDTPEGATAAREDGQPIVPGDPDASLMWQRINMHEAEEIMPPPDSGRKPLDERERALIRQWIAGGAQYEPHWSFVPPTQPAVPELSSAQSDWVRGPIDAFVAVNAAEHGLQMSPQADPATLCRRAFLDLTGLPPTPDELQRFLSDSAPNAYEKLIDRLLFEEPYATRYAERMAVPWMDLARYADTAGIHMDAGRTAWPWRDWVLDALRQNMPFDQFVIEQLAGDLGEHPDPAQVIASGFNRMHVTSDEGGAIAEEYLVEYAVDRTNTTGVAFLGLSLGCARCHDHKFDPVSQSDYYGLLSFFNNIEEPGLYSQVPDAKRALEPFFEVPNAALEGDRARLRQEIAAIELARQAGSPEDEAQARAFAQSLRTEAMLDWSVPTVVEANSEGGATLTPQADGSLLASGAVSADDTFTLRLRTNATNLRAISLDALSDASLPAGRIGRAGNGNAILDLVEVEATSVVDPAKRVSVPLIWAWADIEQPDGPFQAVGALRGGEGRVWAPNAHLQPGDRHLVFIADGPFGFEGGTQLTVKLHFDSVYDQHSLGRVRVAVSPMDSAMLARLPVALSEWNLIGPYMADKSEQLYSTAFGPEGDSAIEYGKDYAGQKWRHAPGVIDGAVANLAQGVDCEYVGRTICAPTAREMEVLLGSDDGIQVYLNESLVHENRTERGALLDQDRVTLQLNAGPNTLVCKVVNTGGAGGFAYRAPNSETQLMSQDVAFLTPSMPAVDAQATSLWRQNHSPVWRAQTAQLNTVESQVKNLEGQFVKTMVMSERPMARPTFVLNRGQYDQPDANRPAERKIPVALGLLGNRPTNRLGLAQWLVSSENPLLARVSANRFWEVLFGVGIVSTSEDFGLQGAYPTNAPLLDWLALKFMSSGWNVKELIRTIVTSSTYRQSSVRTPELASLDPSNVYLSCFPRQRLSAEQIRDQALAVSGLLVERLGGPSVKPYEPEGLWQEVAMPQSNTRVYEQDMGDALWRRSLYTYWKRASPPPAMLAFDVPVRESCAPRRANTNTPMQALVLWNDPQLVEAARNLAERVLLDPQLADDSQRLAWLMLATTGMRLSDELRGELLRALAGFRSEFLVEPQRAEQLVAIGESERDLAVPVPELAAWTLISNTLLSSDAAIVKD